MIVNKDLKLNPQSDRYRICPECTIPFMTPHLGRHFCSTKCANTLNNRIKRHQKQAENILMYAQNIELPIESTVNQNQITDNFIQTSNVQILGNSNPPENLENQIHNSSGKKININLLDALMFNKNEVDALWQELAKNGFDFNLYDSIESLPKCHLKKANYGNYSVVWTNPDKVLITYQKNLLWISQ